MRGVTGWSAIGVGIILAACETGPAGLGSSKLIQKSAQSEELKKETLSGVSLPQGCPSVKTTLQPDKKSMTVSYQEPAADQGGAPLKDLAYTTLYLSFSRGENKAIRVWTNDARGGATVTIRDIAVPSQEVGLCVTATNWARKESPPASLSADRPPVPAPQAYR
jgi:hypothetical protein